METLFGLLVLVGIFVLVVRSTSSKNKASDHRRGEDDAHHPTRISSAGNLQKRPEPYDASTAEKLPRSRVVKGAAYVTDGDTIVINKTQIRLFGIDAPELNHPYGQKAKWAMVKLCKGHTVCAEITEEDEYGRTVAHCTLPDGRDLSAEMVKMGLAIDWPKFSGGKYKAMEQPGVRKKLWLADARQKGRMHVWEKFEAKSARSK